MVLETLNTLWGSKLQPGTHALKSVYRAQFFNGAQKFTKQFLAPTVALSGDACPM